MHPCEVNRRSRALSGMRKVRAPQGRVPANGRWRRLQGKCNRNKPPRVSMRGKDGKARQELTRGLATRPRCKPHPVQDAMETIRLPAACSAIARIRRQRRIWIDDRPVQNPAYGHARTFLSFIRVRNDPPVHIIQYGTVRLGLVPYFFVLPYIIAFFTGRE